MRPLDEKETTVVFEKLFKFVGPNLKNIVERQALEGPTEAIAGRYCFRLHKNRVFYASESLVRRATNVARDRLVHVGTCIGKFTKGGSFRLTIQGLDLIAAHARRKVWVKQTAEKSLTSGDHVLKSDLSRISENVVAGEGVVVFSSADVPLAFGIAAKSAQDCRKMDPKGIVILNQADLGEYLRAEDDL
ncbi:RNA binding protein [Wolffia australiana]